MTIWEHVDDYERYIGRWSRLVAGDVLPWLEPDVNARWLDVGCGSGALTSMILALEAAKPASVTGLDLSDAFITAARVRVADPRATFHVGDAQSLPFADASFDLAVSALALNFLPRPDAGVAEMARVTRPGGIVAAYVWDYAGEMQLIRRFWDAAVALDRAARGLDEGHRFPICRPEPLERLFVDAGLTEVSVRAIDVPTVFRDLDDLWSPFLGGQGPAPSYVTSLSDERRAALREALRTMLPIAHDGSIALIARAWAARGLVGR